MFAKSGVFCIFQEDRSNRRIDSSAQNFQKRQLFTVFEKTREEKKLPKDLQMSHPRDTMETR